MTVRAVRSVLIACYEVLTASADDSMDKTIWGFDNETFQLVASNNDELYDPSYEIDLLYTLTQSVWELWAFKAQRGGGDPVAYAEAIQRRGRAVSCPIVGLMLGAQLLIIAAPTEPELSSNFFESTMLDVWVSRPPSVDDEPPCCSSHFLLSGSSIPVHALTRQFYHSCR